MRETVGESEIDDILTTGKFKVQQDTKGNSPENIRRL